MSILLCASGFEQGLYHGLVKKTMVAAIFPWVTLIVGLTALGTAAIATSSDRWRKPHLPTPPKHAWMQDLLGSQIRLPRTDAKGRPLPSGRPMLVLVMNCTSCSGGPTVVELAKQCPLKPLLLVTPVEVSAIPTIILEHPKDVLVVCDTTAKYVPLTMLDSGPQLARIDASGRVTAVPREDDDMESFITRGGQS